MKTNLETSLQIADKLDLPDATLARLSGTSKAALCRYRNGMRRCPLATERRIHDAVIQLERLLKIVSPCPVDLSKPTKLLIALEQFAEDGRI
jgi:hypothetical protein